MSQEAGLGRLGRQVGEERPKGVRSMSDEVSASAKDRPAGKVGSDGERFKPVGSRFTIPVGHVAVRLGLAFGLVIALLVAVGDLGIRRMDRINADLQDIMSREWLKLGLTGEAVTYSNRNNDITTQIFLLTDQEQIESLLAVRAENSKKISEMVDSLDGLGESEEERRRLAVVKEENQGFFEPYQGARHLLLDEKKHDAAVAVMRREATPSLFRYHSAWDEFVRFQRDQLELAVRNSRDRYAATRRLALLVISGAVALAGIIAFVVIRRLVAEITTRVRAEKEALETAHQEAEVFINAVPSILIGLDGGSRITRWNAAAAKVFTLAEAEAAGKTLTECGIKWLSPGMHDEVQSWFSGEPSRRCDRLLFEVKGETRLLGLTITRVHMVGEDLTRLLVIGSDTTQRNVLEDQLRQAQKLESVGQLAAGIAHEINTPTQYIGDNVRFLKDAFQELKGVLANYERRLAVADSNSPVPGPAQVSAESPDVSYLLEEIPKAIEQTLEGVTRVSTLVGAMKEFSHPGTKEKTLLNLNHAIESTITVARNEWKYVADMETDFDPSLPPVPCRPGEFNQVILNLIVNAAHAIAEVVEKGVVEKGTIKVQTRNCPEWCEIRIQDTGSGIPEKVRAKIFDPFFTTKEIGKGTGQGLAIAHSVVVDKHGGTIHFETQEGVGTTFIIRLPWQESQAAAAKGG